MREEDDGGRGGGRLYKDLVGAGRISRVLTADFYNLPYTFKRSLGFRCIKETIIA